MKPRVLFVCIHNSSRSQMAEAFLKEAARDEVEVFSAGLEAGSLNPYVVHVMGEAGIDISKNRAKSVRDPEIAALSFDHVITVCDEARAQTCPIVPTKGRRVSWDVEDPSSFEGSLEERLQATRRLRDRVRELVSEWYSSNVFR